MWEGAGDRRETAIFWPHCYGRQRSVFLVLMLNRRPRGPLFWVMAFFTAYYQHLPWTPTHQGPFGPVGLMWLSLPHLRPISNCNSSGAPRVPSAWCGFPYHISSLPLSNSNWNWECLISVLTELYNSSTATQSPTRSMKSHVWSSSSGNNCHAVHRSLSSGASANECTMGIFFFTSSYLISQFPPTRFPLITTIRMCHLLPVHHLGMAFLAGSKVKIEDSNQNYLPTENNKTQVTIKSHSPANQNIQNQTAVYAYSTREIKNNIPPTKKKKKKRKIVFAVKR